VNTKFSAGDRVRVAEVFLWAKGATGTISLPPPEVTAISGPWDDNLTWMEGSMLGSNRVYWVWFDVRQYDAEGEGPFIGGCIWETALTRISSAP